MARIPYGKIIRRTWRRENFKQLGAVKRDFLSYLWTGPEGARIPALYYITFGTIAADLGYTEKYVKRLMDELRETGFIQYDASASILLCTKQIIFDEPDNANVVIGWLKQLNELPESYLIGEFLVLIEPYTTQWNIDVSKYYIKGEKAPSLKGTVRVTIPQGLGEQLAPPNPKPEPKPEPIKKEYSACAETPVQIAKTVVDKFNKLCPLLPQVRQLTKPRVQSILRHARDKPPEFWDDLFRRVSATPFLLGENDRGWKADFDFILRPKSLVKILEGSYDRSATRNRQAETREGFTPAGGVRSSAVDKYDRIGSATRASPETKTD